MTQVKRDPSVEQARFTARMVILEEPRIAEKIAGMAAAAGHSMGAEVRGALRYWIAAWDQTGEDEG